MSFLCPPIASMLLTLAMSLATSAVIDPSAQVSADEPPAAQASEPKPANPEKRDEGASDEPTKAKTPALPTSFDRFQQIYFFQSQAAELLPPSFRPIDLRDLDEQLKRIDGGTVTPVDSPQLMRSVYVAKLDRDRLVSTQSYWDIAYGGGEPARLSMGQLGFALRLDSGDAINANAGRIVSDLDGAASVVVDADTRVVFAWTAAGKPIERGFTFDLQIPVSVQTRLLIEVPRDLDVQAIDGVGRALPSPPPEAGGSGTLPPLGGTDKAWYSIEAGGLSRVRLRMISKVQGDTKAILPVRQASIQYEIQPQSIRFTTRMLVDARPDAMLPMLTVDHGKVTVIRVGGSVATWTEVSAGLGTSGLGAGGSGADAPQDESGIRIDSSRLESSSANGTMNITIEGEAAWSTGGGLQALPWPRWLGCRPILVATEMPVQIRLDRGLNALRLQIPEHWRFLPTALAEDGSRLYRCVGSLGMHGPTVLAKPDEKQRSADSVLRLSASSTQFLTQFDASVLMGDTGPQPVQLRMDRGWVADLVTIPSTGRVIDLPNDPVARRNITIWPTSDELVDRRLHIRVTGSMPIRSVGGRVEFPATSFATIQSCRNRVVALVTPPVGFNWTGDVALRTSRITLNELSAVHRSLLGELGTDSLLIDLNEGRIAPLVSRRPDIAFDTANRLTLRVEGDRLIETCLIACDSTSTDIQSIVVDLGDALGRPPMQWSAVRTDGSSCRITSASRVAPDDLVSRDGTAVPPSVPEVPTSGEVWRLDFGDRGERELLLVGRREYRFTKNVRIPLPSVPGAANQNAQVVIMPSLAVSELGTAAFKVPPLTTKKSIIQKFGSIPTESDPGVGSTVLRYDATEKPLITVVASRKSEALPLIWRETVRIEASNRGGDLVTGVYDIDRDVELTIRHDLNMRLLGVTNLKGEAIEYELAAESLRVKASSESRQVVTHWNRPTVSGLVARQWVAPKLEVAGIVLRSDWKMVPAPDTLAPSLAILGDTSAAFLPVARLAGEEKAKQAETPRPLLLGSPASELSDDAGDFDYGAITVEPGLSRVWLIDSGLGYTMVAITGLCVFAFGWWTAMRFPTLCAILWVSSLVPPMFLLATASLWMSAVCVPLAAGGLVALTIRPDLWRLREPGRGRGSELGGGESSKLQWDLESSAILVRDPSMHSVRSWGSRIPFWIIYALIGLCAALMAGQSRAQAPGVSPMPTTQTSPTGNERGVVTEANGKAAVLPVAIEVTAPNALIGSPLLLIPTGEAGELAGTKVYIPQTLYAELFRERTPSIGATRVRTVAYRLRIDGATDSIATAELEARFQLEDSKLRAETRLPFRASQLKSVQWLTDSDTRALRWSADGDSAVRLALPPASKASLLVRLTCEVQSPSRLTRRVRVSVPPVIGSTLLVDSGLAVQRLELAKAFGEIDSQPELGRLSASLGAVDEIDLTLTYRESAKTVASIAQRRYWINAGYDRTNVECEIELSDAAVRRGAEVPLVLVDGQTPIMTTNDWIISATETVSPTRQQLTLTAQRDSPGPVRFLWELESAPTTSAQAVASAAITIPDVLSAGTASTPPAIIALDAAQGLRLLPLRTPMPLSILDQPPTGSPSSPGNVPPSLVPPASPVGAGASVSPNVPSILGPQPPSLGLPAGAPASGAMAAGLQAAGVRVEGTQGEVAPVDVTSDASNSNGNSAGSDRPVVISDANAVASEGKVGGTVTSNAADGASANGVRSSEAIDAFIASWKGYRGTASDVMTASSPLPKMTIASPEPRPWQADEIHHLHVRPGELQLSYSAVITPGDRLAGPMRIVLPVDCDLRAVTMNGTSINTLPRKVGNRDEVSLFDVTTSEPFRLRVILHLRISQAGRFNPPRVSVEPVQIVKGTYTLTRDQSLLIEEVVDGGLSEADGMAMGPGEQLTGGWVPCWTWRIDGVQPASGSDLTGRPQLPGVYRVESRDVTIESQQRTSLVWDQTRWGVEALLRLRGAENARLSGSVPTSVPARERIDFVNVELPTDWCDNLTIEPAVTWSRQPSIDPATQIIRIRPSQVPDSSGIVTIRLRGQRSVNADTRLEVPAVRVLGGGKRDVYMTVPREVDGRELDWEASAAISSPLPEELTPKDSLESEDVGEGDAREIESRLVDGLVFRSVAGNASVRLVPSRLEASAPRNTIADIQLFTANDKPTVMICRWDISPGRSDKVTIDLPPALKPIRVLIDESPASWQSLDERVDVSLALTRLAQSLVLMCELDSTASGGAGGKAYPLPTIRDLPAEQTWMTVYSAADDSNAAKVSTRLREGWESVDESERQLALAASIREVTEASLNRATDRSQEEVARWIEPWDKRIRSLLSKTPANETAQKQKEASDEDTEGIKSDLATQDRWKLNADAWQQYLMRVAGEVSFAGDDEARLVVPPSYWKAISTATYTGAAESLPLIRTAPNTKSLAVGIRVLLMTTITVGLMLLMWRAYGWVAPLAFQPASWLFATGLASMAVAPIPVSVAICVVAVVTPMLNHSIQSRPRK